MIEAKLTRLESSEHGTFGILTIPEKCFCCNIAELPLKDNKKSLSCIPEGTYTVVPYESDSRGSCYHVKGVPERSSILIHPGNFAGDIEKGYKTDSEGCLLPGVSFGELSGQKVVIGSRKAMGFLLDAVKKESFKLTIVSRSM